MFTDLIALRQKIGLPFCKRKIIHKLYEREKQILFLLVLGLTPKVISTFLSKISNKSVTPATIAAHINKKLYIKLQVNDRSTLIAVVIDNNLIEDIPAIFKDIIIKNKA